LATSCRINVSSTPLATIHSYTSEKNNKNYQGSVMIHRVTWNNQEYKEWHYIWEPSYISNNNRKETKRQTMICKTLHRRQKIEQHANELKCSGKGSSYCSTGDTHHVNLATHQVICH
jgi:hypothetical protein